MTSPAASCHGYRFPPEIISYAAWLYHRFCLSFRDTEDLLAERGIIVSYEAIRQWCRRFGPAYARILRRRQGRLGDKWHLDELFVNIQGRQQYLWRAVDQDGDVIDILLQPTRDRPAAERFFRKLLKGQGRAPGRLITDKLRSYSAAHGSVMPENNRAEGSHQPTRQRERQMRRFNGGTDISSVSLTARPENLLSAAFTWNTHRRRLASDASKASSGEWRPTGFRPQLRSPSGTRLVRER